VNYADTLEEAVGIIKARYPQAVTKKKSAIETFFFRNVDDRKTNATLGTITIKQKRKHAKSCQYKEAT
jgi:hypothetical protein